MAGFVQRHANQASQVHIFEPPLTRRSDFAWAYVKREGNSGCIKSLRTGKLVSLLLALVSSIFCSMHIALK